MEKPGYKTTEFWLSVLATALSFLLASDVLPASGSVVQAIGLVGAALTAMGYTVSRSIVKRR
jgi:hypothetical protein